MKRLSTRRRRRTSRRRVGGNAEIRYKATDVLEAMGLTLTGPMTLDMFFRLLGIPVSADGYVKREDLHQSMMNRGMGHRFDAIDALLTRY